MPNELGDALVPVGLLVLGSLLTTLGGVVQWCLEGRREALRQRRRAAEQAEERIEWYRRTLFERRLGAVQEAYEWLSKLNIALNRATGGDPAQPGSQELVSIAKAARAWYDRNTIWLRDEIPDASSFIRLTNVAMTFTRRPNVDVWRSYAAAFEVIKARADRLMTAEQGVGPPGGGGGGGGVDRGTVTGP